jgi:hypothetical protein
MSGGLTILYDAEHCARHEAVYRDTSLEKMDAMIHE